MGGRQACRSAAGHPWIAVLCLSALLAPHRMAGGWTRMDRHDRADPPVPAQDQGASPALMPVDGSWAGPGRPRVLSAARGTGKGGGPGAGQAAVSSVFSRSS